MPVPSAITDLSTTAASNSPAGGESVLPNLDDYLRAHAAFIAQLRAGGTRTGSVTIQSGSAEMHLTLGSSGGYFYGQPTQAGWFKEGGAHVNWNTANGNFATNGSITASGNITAYSDERLKNDIETIAGGLALVKRLRGVRYTRDGVPGIGVIAQEMQEVVPEVVREGEYLSVAYGNLVGLLIEAVKELAAEVERLK